jgi:acetylornithine deacetylase
MIDPIPFLEKLISFPTVSHEPINDCVDFLCTESEHLGFSVRKYQSSPTKSNIIAHIGPQEEALVLCGHMDVVPVSGQKWSRDPFSMDIQGDRIYGRGSCDMKGFFAASYHALSHLKMNKLKRGISLIWTHDEEVGCVGAQKLCSTLTEKNISIPKSMLIGEPTSQNIARMHGGHSTLLLRIQGAPAHSSKPDLGVSAILAATQSITAIANVQELLKKKPCVHTQMNGACSLINVAQIQGGEAVNIIPEHCEILLGIRPMPGQSPDRIYEQLKRAIAFALKNTKTTVSWELIQEAPPMYTRENTALEQFVQQTFTKASSIGLPFATDGGCFATMGVEPIICGPGSINQAHKADEFISKTELFSYTEGLLGLLSKWCI